MDKGMNVSYEIICKCGRKLSDSDIAGGICPWCHRVVDNNVQKVVVRESEIVKKQKIVGNQFAGVPECIVVIQPPKDPFAEVVNMFLFFLLLLLFPIYTILFLVASLNTPANVEKVQERKYKKGE